MKKILLIVQGINDKREYINSNSSIFKTFIGRYDDIEYMYTEDIFDKGWFLDKWDFIPYFMSEKRRKAVCRLVNEKIATLNLLGYRVDILAHSLGCIISLQSGRRDMPIAVDNLFALQSPTHNRIYGWYVRSQVIKYSYGIDIKNIFFTYNKHDRLVASKKINLKNFADRFIGTLGKLHQYSVGAGHDWLKAFKQLYIKLFNCGVFDELF